jgi:hypothetical protein
MLPAAGGDYRTWLDNLGDDQVRRTAEPSGSRGGCLEMSRAGIIRLHLHAAPGADMQACSCERCTPASHERRISWIPAPPQR